MHLEDCRSRTAIDLRQTLEEGKNDELPGGKHYFIARQGVPLQLRIRIQVVIDIGEFAKLLICDVAYRVVR